jgi:hypothetical protein
VTLATDAVTILLDGALGAWLGTMAFFSFVGAPKAFAVFGDDAGKYVNDVFPRYYTVGVVLGAVAFVSVLGRGVLDGFDAAGIAVVLSAAVAAGIMAYSRWGLIMTSVGNYRIDRPTAGGRTGNTLH